MNLLLLRLKSMFLAGLAKLRQACVWVYDNRAVFFKYPKLTAVCLAIVFLGFSWRNYPNRYAIELNHAQAFLNTGSYPEAKIHFQKAIDLQPIRQIAAIAGNISNPNAAEAMQQALDSLNLSSEALWGLEKTKIFDLRDKEQIKQKLTQFETDHPKDADVHILWGRYYLSLREIQPAFERFNIAKELNPKLAEAYAGFCTIYDWANDLEAALEWCQKAIQVSGTEPGHYLVNLAGVYSQKGMYPEAIQALNKIEAKYLYMQLDLAKLYLLTNRYGANADAPPLTPTLSRREREQDDNLAQAVYFQNSVLQGLNDADIVRQPENSGDWYYKTDQELFILSRLEDKKCYVEYGLTAMLYLNGELEKAQSLLKQFNPQSCNPKIKQLALFDLNRAQDNETLKDRVAAFIKQTESFSSLSKL